jgi:hypothetical protein
MPAGEKRKTGFLEKYPLYPFLIAIYPIVYLMSENISHIGVNAGLRSVLILLGIALLAFLFSLLLSRNIGKSGIITLVMILAFFLVFFILYAPLYHALRERQLFGMMLGRHRYLVPLTAFFILLSAMASWLLLRRTRQKPLRKTTFALNTVGIVLMLIPLIGIVNGVVKKQVTAQLKKEELPPLAVMTSVPEELPDIYLIILDMHTSDAALQFLTGYEDQTFSDALRDSGFYIAACSTSNYPVTIFSITSELNMDYVQNITDSRDTRVLYQFMQNSRVQRTLQEAGYHTYAFETGYKYTDLVNADEFYSPADTALALLTYPGVSPFESLILQVSGGKILYETREQLSKRMQYLIDAPYVEYRDRILYTLDTLPGLAETPGPKFVFTHILAPHDPFVFDEDGNTAFRKTPFTLDQDPEYDWKSYSTAYIKELQYLHKRILEIVSELQTNSRVQPIIIIQGDHGIPRTWINDTQYEIYNAIYTGGQPLEGVYSSISPVNSFRLIFNQFFGTDYELLPDEKYYMEKDSGDLVKERNEFTCP